MSDPNKRLEYNRTNFSHVTSNRGYNGSIFDSIFTDIFEGFYDTSPNIPTKGENVNKTIDISFKESVLGTQKEISYTSFDENGNRHENFLTISIPPGIRKNSTLVFAGKGSPGVHGGSNGDLKITIKILDEENFSRHGNNILYNLTIGFTEATLGTKVEVPTIDGKVKIRIPEGTQSGTILKVPGKGVRDFNSGIIGDFLVKVQVKVPTDLTRKEKSLIKKLDKLLKKNHK